MKLIINSPCSKPFFIRYQIMVLELLAQSTYTEQGISLSHRKSKSTESQILEINPPNVLDLSKDTEYAFQAALWGIEVWTVPLSFFKRKFFGIILQRYKQYWLVSGPARLGRNLSFGWFRRQAWFGWPRYRWMSSGCNASILRTDIVGRSYKGSSGIISAICQSFKLVYSLLWMLLMY